MDQIPLEIFVKITGYLKTSEKLELLRVCQYWYKAIKYTNLYNDFKIKFTLRLIQALLMFDQEPELARQVESLYLVKPDAQFNTILTLPSRFPSLTEFIWEDYLYEEFLPITVPDNMEEWVKPWQRLKVIQETARNLSLPTILQSSTLHNLVKLTINTHYFESEDYNKEIVPYLDHAPNLEYLDLTFIAFTLERMDQLHEKAPKLHTLILKETNQQQSELDRIFEVEQQLQSDTMEKTIIIQPAINLKNLVLDRMRVQIDGGIYGLESRWMTYISLKYPNMEQFSVIGVGINKVQRPFYEEGLRRIVSSCTKIQKYKCRMSPLIKNVLEAMDDSGMELKELEVLTIGTITVKDQLLDLLSSNQKNIVTSLRILQGKNDQQHDFFDILCQFPKLKSLHIETTATITINRELKKLKKLESLSLASCFVFLDVEDIDIMELKLKSLQLDKVMIINTLPTDNDDEEEETVVDVFQYISERCPYLTKLWIQGQVNSKGTKPFLVQFPNHYFSSIKVYILGNIWYQVNNQLWYKFRGNNLVETIKDEELVHRPHFYVSVVYKGLTIFNIGGTVIPSWI